MVKLIFEDGKKSTTFYFLKVYLKYLFELDIDDYYVESTEGYNNTILSKFKPNIEKWNNKHYKVIVFFDSDYSNKNGGYGKRSSEISRDLERLELKFNFFLFPTTLMMVILNPYLKKLLIQSTADCLSVLKSTKNALLNIKMQINNPNIVCLKIREKCMLTLMPLKRVRNKERK